MVSPLPNQQLPGFMQNFNMQGPGMPTFGAGGGAGNMSDAGVRNIMMMRQKMAQDQSPQIASFRGGDNSAYMQQFQEMMKRYEAAMANREQQASQPQGGGFDFGSMFGGANYAGPAGSGSSFQQPQQQPQTQNSSPQTVGYGGSLPGGVSYGGPSFGYQGSTTNFSSPPSSSQFFY
jgi:hypothetical protein